MDCYFSIFRISIKEFIGEKNIEYITYWFVYETFRVFTFKNEWYITWILAMLGTDHSYYWAHRMILVSIGGDVDVDDDVDDDDVA